MHCFSSILKSLQHWRRNLEMCRRINIFPGIHSSDNHRCLNHNCKRSIIYSFPDWSTRVACPSWRESNEMSQSYPSVRMRRIPTEWFWSDARELERTLRSVVGRFVPLWRRIWLGTCVGCDRVEWRNWSAAYHRCMWWRATWKSSAVNRHIRSFPFHLEWQTIVVCWLISVGVILPNNRSLLVSA